MNQRIPTSTTNHHRSLSVDATTGTTAMRPKLVQEQAWHQSWNNGKKKFINKFKFLWNVRTLVLVLTLLLLVWVFRIYRYQKTVRFNRKSLGSKARRHDDDMAGAVVSPWWQGKNITVWTIWIGKDDPPPLIQAAMQTCRDVHQDDPYLHYRVVTNVDLLSSDLLLGFPLHSSFGLLDTVEQSDYLRAELMHYHGGFYMDADMLCLNSLRRALVGNLEAAAAQDRTKYGKWPSVSQNSLGPFMPKSAVTTEWHDGLHETMDTLTPQLLECLGENKTIPYPQSRTWGVSLCGVPWGGVIDFVKPVWLKYATAGLLGHDLSLCNVKGEHLGWDDVDRCDIVHLGTAGKFYEKKHWNMDKLCRELPALHRKEGMVARGCGWKRNAKSRIFATNSQAPGRARWCQATGCTTGPSLGLRLPETVSPSQYGWE